MGEVHDLIREKGRQGALEELKFDRMEIETAAAYLANDDIAVGFLYSGWCQANLPHRRLPDGEAWALQNEHASLIVEPGMRLGRTGKPEPVGVPYGSRARLILIYLQSEAIRTRSREITLGRSLRDWLHRLKIPAGGTSIAAVREQAERLSLCRMTLRVQSGGRMGLVNQNIVDTALFLDDQPEGQGSLFLETARLSEGFYSQLQRHPVPLEEAAVCHVANNSMALDVYAWLAYRLHSLSAPRSIRWKAVMSQFGGGYGKLSHFKPRFLTNLKLALSVYPDARVEVDGNGLVLHPSRPPLAEKARSIR